MCTFKGVQFPWDLRAAGTAREDEDIMRAQISTPSRVLPQGILTALFKALIGELQGSICNSRLQ